MRWFATLVLALPLGVMGCSDSDGPDELCEAVVCDAECRVDGVCSPYDGTCHYDGFAENGTACAGGECVNGVCFVGQEFPCTEQGVHDAIVAGGGPHTFDCDVPTTLRTRLWIDNDVILDGGGLTIDSTGQSGGVAVLQRTLAELRDFTVTGLGISNAGALTLRGVTVSGNEDAGIYNTGTVVLSNSTVSGNGFGSAGSPGCGVLNERGLVVFAHCTLSGNAGPAICDGFSEDGNLALMSGTIVDGECATGPNGETDSLDHSIESPGDTCFDRAGNQVNVSAGDLKLGELGDNGGPTETLALGEGSVAIDFASRCEDWRIEFGFPKAGELRTDQRGFPRDSICDVGAFEAQP